MADESSVYGFCAAEFRGRVALITGGTDGLGKHLSQTLAKAECDVFFCGRREELGRALAAEWGPRAHFIRCDLADADDARAFVRQAGEFKGRIDFVVNNAAVDTRIEFATARLEDFDRMVAVNLRPYFVVSQAALPWLEAGEGKAIVNLCTTNYMLGLSPFTIYNATKSGIVGFTRSLARELGPLGIRANTLSPGWIMTEKQLREYVSERDKEDLLRDQALKFLMKDEHVTPAALFFLSRASAGVTGQNLVVDGGKVMQ